jgi:hypothetical protein
MCPIRQKHPVLASPQLRAVPQLPGHGLFDILRYTLISELSRAFCLLRVTFKQQGYEQSNSVVCVPIR